MHRSYTSAMFKQIVFMLLLGQLVAGHRLEFLKSILCEVPTEETKCCNTTILPLVPLGSKFYYFNHFFRLNWYKAYEFCRFYGMNLCTVSNVGENEYIKNYLQSTQFGGEYFWTSGTDLGSEGKFFWMSTGRPFIFTDWSAGQPDNAVVNAEFENCVHFWDSKTAGINWNDLRCSLEHYFICETEDMCISKINERM